MPYPQYPPRCGRIPITIPKRSKIAPNVPFSRSAREASGLRVRQASWSSQQRCFSGLGRVRNQYLSVNNGTFYCRTKNCTCNIPKNHSSKNEIVQDKITGARARGGGRGRITRTLPSFGATLRHILPVGVCGFFFHIYIRRQTPTSRFPTSVHLLHQRARHDTFPQTTRPPTSVRHLTSTPKPLLRSHSLMPWIQTGKKTVTQPPPSAICTTDLHIPMKTE